MHRLQAEYPDVEYSEMVVDNCAMQIVKNPCLLYTSAPGYYPVPAGYDSWVKKDHIEKAPAWCSVDPVSYTHL